MVDDLEWQYITPRYGYEIPQLIEDAGLSEAFEACFDISLELFSYLQSAGYHNEAQYAALHGQIGSDSADSVRGDKHSQ